MFGVVGTTFGIVIAWATIYLILFGWGVFWPAQQLSLTGARCWTGLGLVIGFLQVWHLFLPVDWRATAVVIVVGAAGLLRIAHEALFSSRPPCAGLSGKHRIA